MQCIGAFYDEVPKSFDYGDYSYIDYEAEQTGNFMTLTTTFVSPTPCLV
jgi:hypothetical protein